MTSRYANAIPTSAEKLKERGNQMTTSRKEINNHKICIIQTFGSEEIYENKLLLKVYEKKGADTFQIVSKGS